MGELDHRTLIIGGTREELSLLRGILRREFPSSTDPPRQPMGDAALEALRSDPPDLVLALASTEPGRLFDLIGSARGLGTDISLVILAAEGRSELAGRTSTLEAAEILDFGPETGSELARAIRKALDRHSEVRERERLRALVEVAREALSVIDPTGVVRYASPSISRMLGYAPEERVGMNAVNDVHPEDRPRVRRELQRLLREPEYLPHLRYRMRHKNGEWRTHDSVARNRLDDPSIRGIVVSALDVTDEAEAQERIRYQATLLNAVGQAVIATDLEGVVIYWNRAAEELYGWAPTEAVGRQIVELTAPSPRRAQAEEIMETLRRRGRWSGEFEVQRRDGSTFTAYVANSPVIDSGGDVIGIIGVSSDLSDLKRAEEALRERIKELQTLYRVSQIVNRSDLSLRDRLQGVVDLLPSGWLHPEVTEARLVLQDMSVQTPDFRETPWMRSARIAPSTHLVGRLDIVLTEERPEKDDGPFLVEERELLDALAQTIGEAFERDRLARLLRKTIASLEEAVIVVEPAEEGYRIRDANPATERIFGYSREKLVDTEIDFSLLFPDRQAYERFQAECDAALGSSEVFHGSASMRREDGTPFDAEQTVTLLDANKGLEGERVFAVRDVSGRRRAEERFGVLSREIVDHIYVLGADLGVLYSTPSVERFIGITKEEFESLEGPEILELVHPEDRERVLGSVMESLDTPGSTSTSQYRVTRPDGEIRHVEAIVRNLLEDPVLGGLVVTTRDVTKRLELEERMRQGQKLEAVGRLAGGIAHDFNNILTVIRSQTDLLLLDELDRDSLATELEIIQASVDRASTLTDQLLAFSRDQLLKPKTIDLAEVVRSTAGLVERVIGEDITVEYDLWEELPPIEVDPGQLEQAVFNLAVNARDAMPQGGTLTLSAYREEEIRAQQAGAGTTEGDGGRIVRTILRVSDTGTGMSADTLSRVFEPFYTTKAKGKGTGLGLSMVYGFVEQSGGSIHVESRIGEGSTFYLGFPASSGVPIPSSPPTAAARTEGGPPELRGALLLVEDDPAVQRATKRILEAGGLKVLAVGDAESGLELLEGGRTFDIVLTDFVLPRMNGRDLVRRIRASAPELPVVVMSGYAEGPTGQELDLPVGVDFLQKPFTRDELMERVRQALNHETL